MAFIISGPAATHTPSSGKADATARPASTHDAGTTSRATEAGTVRIRTRSPRTQVLLGRLRSELGRIDEPPTSAGQAHGLISAALARARLGGWTLPALDASSNHPQRDGSIVMPLVSHVIVFNPWGAFRIIDCLRPRLPYFEMASAEGRGFVLPWLGTVADKNAAA
jgi:hypothetical protein